MSNTALLLIIFELDCDSRFMAISNSDPNRSARWLADIGPSVDLRFLCVYLVLEVFPASFTIGEGLLLL